MTNRDQFDGVGADSVDDAITLQNSFAQPRVSLLGDHTAGVGNFRYGPDRLHHPFGEDSRIAGRILGNEGDDGFHLSGGFG